MNMMTTDFTALEQEIGDAVAAGTLAAAELENEMAQHRSAIADYDQRAADARKAGKTAIARLLAEQKAARERAAAEQRALTTRIADARAMMAEEIATAGRLAAGRRAALEVLAS